MGGAVAFADTRPRRPRQNGCSRGPAKFSAGPSLAPVCGKGYEMSPYAQLSAMADG